MPHATSNCETFVEFLTLHKEQLEASAIPEIFWKSLFYKLKGEVYDAGEYFMIQKVEVCEVNEESEEEGEGSVALEEHSEITEVLDDESFDESVQNDSSWRVVVTKEGGLKKSDPENIFLVDHAWTYRVAQARKHLLALPSLLARMTALMEIKTENKSVEENVEDVLQAMWKFNLTYSLPAVHMASDESCPIWYIMDEFGSRVQHSDNPTFQMVPFYYQPAQLSYTLMWPVVDMAEGDEVTRDYVIGVTDMLTRKLRLLPWKPTDMTHLSFDLQEPEESFFAKYKVHETLPDPNTEAPALPRDRSIRVYTDYELVMDHLTDNRFELVNKKEDADIIWTSKTIRNFLAWSEGTHKYYLNQFPFEMIITIKNLLAAVGRRVTKRHIDHDTLESKIDWLPITFNLSSELGQFVSYFQQREKRGLSNYWICKPWNLGLGLDLHITNNLAYILRLPDTGPKIASLYVDNPVLIERENVGRVKFDLRFLVMLVSVKPLTIYVHKKFLIRYANIAFSMDHFDEYEKHFTVMTARKDAETHEVRCEDFIATFEQQYPGFLWKTVEAKIYVILKQLFEAATIKAPPLGIGHSPISRAVYGIDIMLKWKTDEKGIQSASPVLIECNFGPNNERFCRYYSDFMNDIFSVLFLGDVESRNVVLL